VAPPAGGAFLDMTRGPVGRRGAANIGTILAALLVIGLVLRIFVAGIYLPLSGFAIDIGDFAAWGQRLASGGPGSFYEESYFSDYPPGYLYVLWVLGLIGRALTPIVGMDATAGLVKIPGILADIGVAWLLFVICRRWAGQLLGRLSGRIGTSVSAERLGLIAATIYLFNPGVIFNSAVWGQIDSVGALILLGTVYLLGRGWTEAASVTATLALLVKFQFAFIIPIVVVVGLKRHLFGRSSDPEHRARDPLRILFSVAAAVTTLFVVTFPFGMSLYVPLSGGDPRGLLGILPEADPVRSLIGKFIEAAGTYTGYTINAFNMWRNPWTGLGDTLHWGDDTTIALALGGLTLTWQQVGVVLFAAVALLALWVVARRDDVPGVLIACLLLAIAFFVLPTRVHERYLFPALALAAPLVLRRPLWTAIYGALTLSFFANVYWVYTEDWSFTGRVINPGAHGEPMPQDPVLEATLLSDWGIYLISALSLVTLGVVAWRAIVLALRPAEMPELMPPPVETQTLAPAPPPALEPLPDGGDRSPLAWLRPDPADPFLRERPRRLDRLDAALLLGLVLVALLFRLWRLDMPRDTYFDEVYHARSATEWLANWQNGYDRDVYEWTHPMLAKYLIAAGIVVADPNKVVDRTTLSEPAAALAVAPERQSLGRDRSILFSGGGGTEITARDAESGDVVASWSAGGPIAALAYDEAGDRLLVGRQDSGAVGVYELADFLAGDGARAPPPAAAPIETGLTSVDQIVAADGAGHLLLRSPEAVASVDRASGEQVASAEIVAAHIAHLGTFDPDPNEEGDEFPERLVASEPRRGVVAFYDTATLESVGDEIAPDAELTGPLVTRGAGDDQQVFALTGGLPETIEHPATEGGLAVIDGDGSGNPCTGVPCLVDTVPFPGRGSVIGHQHVANLIYVGGTDADGRPTAWTINPLIDERRSTSTGVATFDATELPGEPLAFAFDVSGHSQGDDHGRLIVATTGAGGGDAQLVALDAGSNAFAWRLSGVVFGVVLVALVYLLAATMFSRRRIAVLAGGFMAFDAMSYVMSRISMNDIFVATFIVAAYLVFWQVWSGRWQRSAWWALPFVGVFIGLAAGTKWVGFYALAGLWILVLARSALGRLVLVAGAAFVFVAGGIGAPWPFAVVAAGALALALLLAYVRPIRLDLEELMFAVPATVFMVAAVGLAFALAYQSVEGPDPSGAVEVVFAVLARGAEAGWPGLLMLGLAGLLLLARAVASLRDPTTDARWLRPGSLGGFGWSWIGACLVVVPLAVYALTYVPYLQLGHVFSAGSDVGPGYGWSIDALHRQMFGYHFGLTASHPSASPWWSWPLILKPTWFQSDHFDASQIAVIYNGGNPILFWAGVPAIVAAGFFAWKRRSMALVLLVVAFALQFLPWTRIERATFAYHYLTAVPFAVLAVAYFVDELLRRPDWRDLAIGYLLLAGIIGMLIFPLGAALPMPDWYINAFRALPPWMFDFQFPVPSAAADRGELLDASGPQLVAALAAALVAGVWAIFGRSLVGRWFGIGGPGGRGITEPAEG
jgi:predicted membrane-bound dolichyl-phosphate-mannose-protein mannosyltransferase